jgi:signal peptidase II
MMPVPLLVSLALILAIDQATKALVLTHLDERQAIVCGKVAIRRLINRRMARGLLFAPRRLVMLWGAAVMLIVALVHFVPFGQDTTAQVAIGAALGGAAGNLCDVVRRGGVVDFLDVGFWPVFNLGDAAIVIGGAIGLFRLST